MFLVISYAGSYQREYKHFEMSTFDIWALAAKIIESNNLTKLERKIPNSLYRDVFVLR